MLIKKPADIPSSEITPKSLYLNRRKFLAGTVISGAASVAGMSLGELAEPMTVQANTKVEGIQESSFSTTEKITPLKDVSNYNNYYEFSTDKYEPAKLAKDFKTRPWTVTIDGQVKKKQVLDVDAIMKMATPEERIYRHRCVEGWSIVVPWVGFSLSELINKVDPMPKAKFIEFTTVLDPNHMPGQREWARDDDGDGIREVHSNTIEGLWTGLRNHLRPFRGISSCRTTKPYSSSSALWL